MDRRIESSATSFSLPVRCCRWLYFIASWLLVAAVVAQFLLAGVGVFAPVDLCNLVPNRSVGCGFALHVWFGRFVISFLFVAILALCFAARAPRRTTALTSALPGLFALQGLLVLPAGMGGPIRLVAALHVVNGLFILLVALRVTGRAGQLLSEARRSTARSALGALPRSAEGERA